MSCPVHFLNKLFWKHFEYSKILIGNYHSIDRGLRPLRLLIIVVIEECDAAPMDRLHSGDAHRTSQELLKSLIFLLFSYRTWISWISDHVDASYDCPAQRTILVVLEPWLDALLVEEVLPGVTRHSHDGGALDERFAANKTLLQWLAEIVGAIRLWVLCEIDSELLARPSQSLHVALSLGANCLEPT